MSLTFSCGHCGKTFTIDDKFAGKKGKCKQCGSVMQIPGSGPSQAPSPDPAKREISPSRMAPAPAPVLSPYVFEVDDDPRPGPSAVMELDEDDFEPIRGEQPLSRSARSFDPPKPKKKKKKQSTGEESPAVLIGRILLGLAIGSAGTYASMEMIKQVQKTRVAGLLSKDEAEAMLKERIALNEELAEMIVKIEDVPSAEAASAAVNQKIRALTANLHKMRMAKALPKDIAALNRQYEGRMNQVTTRLVKRFEKLGENPEVFNALNVTAAMKELDTEEKFLPGNNTNANVPGAPMPRPIPPPVAPPRLKSPQQSGMPNGPNNRNRPNRNRGNAPNFGPPGPR